MTITYQQAKRIRKTGWLSLMADQLMYEKKVTTAISKTISLKTRGTMMGIGQYIDPLNIARVLTFGSSIGPALLGHWTGRDPRDIQYFSKRYKPIHERKTTGNKLSKIGGGAFDSESNQVLHKIYTLMSNSYDMDKKRYELANNRKEENQLEDDKKHKELLEALKGRPTLIKIGEEKKDKSWIEKMMEFMDTVGKTFSAIRILLQKAIGGVIGWMLKRLGSVTRMFMSVMTRVGAFLMRSLVSLGGAVFRIFSHRAFLGVLGVAAAGAALMQFHKSLTATQAKLDYTNAELADEYRNLAILQSKAKPNPEAIEKQKQIIADVEWKKSDLEAEVFELRKKEDSGSISDMISGFGDYIESLKGDLTNFGNFNIGDDIMNKLEKTPTVDIPEDFSDVNIGAGGGDWGSAFKNFFDAKFSGFDREKSDALAQEQGRFASGQLQKLPEPVAENVTSVSRPSTTVSQPSIENNDTKLQTKVALTVPKNETNVSNLTQGSDKIPLRRKVPSIRNNEESYVNSIFENTRVP